MDDAAKAQFSDATFESVLAEVAAEGLRGAALEASLKEREETSRANCARDAEVSGLRTITCLPGGVRDGFLLSGSAAHHVSAIVQPAGMG